MARLSYKPFGASEAKPIGNEAGRELFAALQKVGTSTRAERSKTAPEARSSRTRGASAAGGRGHSDERGQFEVRRLIKRYTKPIDIKRAGSRISVPMVQERLDSPEFQALWDRIQHRTRFRVAVEEDSLREEMVTALREMAPVPRRKGEWLTHVVDRIDQGGLAAETSRARRADVVYEDSENLPDILSGARRSNSVDPRDDRARADGLGKRCISSS